ncbi:Methylesterase 1 [Mucuna pruriens]|uniref:Methylesterase 1 n=1 Tax=Mucuna pruriens TaxID=157652 RepID=A0A371EVS2_MUCPR|nr:Methylesterase 1 [Mucuna pruriens]
MSWKSTMRIRERGIGWTLNSPKVQTNQHLFLDPNSCPTHSTKPPPLRIALQDIELVKTLLRPGSHFAEDLSQQKNFSKQGYGSVPLAFIVCTEDLTISLNFQLWMIQNAGINDVVEIKGADHMPMISKPQELCDSLLQIATKFV